LLRTVMIPTDFSDECDLVIRFATGLVDLGVRRAIVAHVVEASGMEGPVIASKVDAARDAMREVVIPLKEAGLDVEVRILAGQPYAELLGLAADANVDAIVCGSSGKSVRDQLFVGSVSERVAMEAACPTLMIRYDLLRNAADPAELARKFASRLLVPTDFSGAATRALQTSILLPAKSVVWLRVLHVLPTAPTDERGRRTEMGAEFHLRNLVDLAKEKGITASPTLRYGSPEREILGEVHDNAISGIVMGTRGRNALAEALMGSASMTLVRQASVPVMVVP
jgi:nucleotide-binding universal stress UspA family protein